MVVDEGAAEADDGQLACGAGVWLVEEKDVVDGGSTFQGMRRTGKGGVGGETAEGGGDGGGLGEGGETLVGLFAAMKKEGCHEEDAADEVPEEDALVTGDHRGAPAVGALGGRQELRRMTMAG